jgi:hypothetical protein
MTSPPNPPESSKEPLERTEGIAEPERQEDPDFDKQPEVDPADAGLPSSSELDDDNTVVTPPNADDEPGSAAG